MRLWIAITLFLSTLPTWSEGTAGVGRIVSAGGTVTEIAYALGIGNDLVGVDISSLYPAEALHDHPSVGYVRTLSAEGILSLKPQVLLTTVDAGPPAVLSQLRSSGVKVEVVPSGNTWDAALERIRFIARIVGRTEAGAALESSFVQQKAIALDVVKSQKKVPRVLFLYSRGASTLMVSGTGTEADAMITMAGGSNAVTAYTGYRPLTPEALAQAHPDIVLMTTRGLEALGGQAGLMEIPGFKTGAGTAKIVAMDDLLLLGFGPRLPEAILHLVRQWAE